MDTITTHITRESPNANHFQSVFIVRHGIREDFENPQWKLQNPDRVFDPPLSGTGLQQAREVGVRLKAENITHIFVSPYVRTLQTAHEINKQLPRPLPIKIEHGFMEWFSPASKKLLQPHLIEPLPISKLKEMFPEFIIDESYRSRIDPLPHVIGAGESYQAVHQRCKKAVKTILKEFRAKDENVLIVSHAASTIALSRAMLSLESEEMASPTPIRTGVCSITKFSTYESNGDITIAANEWIMHLNGDASHLSTGEMYHWSFDE